MKNKLLEEKAIISYEWLVNAIKSEKIQKSNKSIISIYSNTIEDKRILCRESTLYCSRI